MNAASLRFGDIVADTNRTNGKLKLAVVTAFETGNLVSIRLWSAQGLRWTSRRMVVDANTLRPLTLAECRSRAAEGALASLNGEGSSELLGSCSARLHATETDPETSIVEQIARFVCGDGTDAQRGALADAIRTEFGPKT